MAVDTVPAKLLDPTIPVPGDITDTHLLTRSGAGWTGTDPATLGATIGLADGEVRGNPRHLGNWTPTAGSAPDAVWQFTQANIEALRDSSTPIPNAGSGGAGLTLTLASGAVLVHHENGLSGVRTEADIYIGPDNDALRYDRAFTIYWIGRPDPLVTVDSQFFYINHGPNPNGGVDDNALAGLYLVSANGGSLQSFHEYGAGGTNEFQDILVSQHLKPAVYAMTRDSTGLVVKLYQDGNLIYTATHGTAPERGGDGSGDKQRWRFGGGAGGNECTAIFQSIALYGEEHSAAQVLEITTAAWGGATP